MSRCTDREELLALVAQSDLRVVRWCALGCGGLRARVAGGSRVSLCRRSPGTGVHRRRRHGYRFAERLAACAQFGRVLSVPESVRHAGGGSMCVRVVGCGSRWHGCKGKCLQSCVSSLFDGAQRGRVDRNLRKNCKNHSGSGYGGTRDEARNLEWVH